MKKKREKLPPVHPGEILREDFWEAMGITQYRLAKDIGVEDRRGHRARWPDRGSFAVTVGQDSDPPLVEHTPAQSCVPGHPLRLAFRIRDASPLVAAKLHYQHLTRMEQFESAELKASGEFHQATIPGAYIDARYDLIYYVEAVDQFGNATFYPDPDRSLPYVVVKVFR